MKMSSQLTLIGGAMTEDKKNALIENYIDLRKEDQGAARSLRCDLSTDVLIDTIALSNITAVIKPGMCEKIFCFPTAERFRLSSF